jgi:hypothetical protein
LYAAAVDGEERMNVKKSGEVWKKVQERKTEGVWEEVQERRYAVLPQVALRVCHQNQRPGAPHLMTWFQDSSG